MAHKSDFKLVGLVVYPCVKTVLKNKAVFLSVAILTYIAIFVLIYVFFLANRLAHGGSLIPLPGLATQGVDHILYKQFNRSDLIVTFRSVPSSKDLNPMKSIDSEFTCTQQKGTLLGAYDAEDVMCVAKFSFDARYRNPCFYFKMIKSMHCLPYFHILGADKCGTTDFFSKLSSHPDILQNSGGLGKETYFWCWLRLGLWMLNKVPNFRIVGYLQYFKAQTAQIVQRFDQSNAQLITGDGTPMDFWDFRGWPNDPQNKGFSEPKFLTPHAMSHIYKDPKFILLFREPVERLYSDYIFMGHGFTPEKFAHDVPIAIDMMKRCLKINSTRQCFFSNWMYENMPMRLHISCYSIFLREWLAVFPKENFLIIRTEDYHSDTVSVLQKAFSFLGVRALPADVIQVISQQATQHQTVAKKHAGNIFPETRKLLEEFYVRFNEDLASLLKDDKFLWSDTKTT